MSRMLALSLFASALLPSHAAFKPSLKATPAQARTPVHTPLTANAQVHPLPPSYAKATKLQAVLPAAAYASLAGAGLAAVHFVQPVLAWQGIALMTGCIAIPMGIAVAKLLSMGGAGVAANMGGKPAPPHLESLARDAASAVGAPAPAHVYLVPSKEPNAFATGMGAKDSTVAVTSGLMDVLTDAEVRAVLAHEMGHLLYRDVNRNMHVAVAAIGLGGLYESGRLLYDASHRKKKNDESSTTGIGLGLMAAGLGAQGIAHLLRLGASRSAELRADAAAAAAFGADTLISALKKIHLHGQRHSDLRNSAAGRQFAFAMISDGQSPSSSSFAAAKSAAAGTRRGWLQRAADVFTSASNMLRTHPSLDERIASLNRLTASGEVPRRSGLRSFFG